MKCEACGKEGTLDIRASAFDGIKKPYSSANYFTRDKKTASIFIWKITGGLIVFDSSAAIDMCWIACSCERYEHIDRDAAIKSIEAGHMMIPPWKD